VEKLKAANSGGNVALPSPDDFESRVESEFDVRRYDRDLLGKCLSNNLAIEWVAMMKMKGQFE
jgi:hypothetical protein